MFQICNFFGWTQWLKWCQENVRHSFQVKSKFKSPKCPFFVTPTIQTQRCSLYETKHLHLDLELITWWSCWDRRGCKEREVDEMWTLQERRNWVNARTDISFLLCCLTLFCLVVHVSSSSFRLSFNRSSWMLSVEVQIRVEKLSELETAKKTPPDFIPPEASSVCLCRSIQRGSTDLRINQWCKCEGKGRSCSTIQSRIDDRLTSRLHTV